MTLDGYENSVKRTIDTVKLYADISGLKANFDKTKAACFGSLKYCHVKYPSEYRIVWDPGIFLILGLKVSVDLEIMVRLTEV